MSLAAHTQPHNQEESTTNQPRRAHERHRISKGDEPEEATGEGEPFLPPGALKHTQTRHHSHQAISSEPQAETKRHENEAGKEEWPPTTETLQVEHLAQHSW